jgi:hypothetical protein
LSKPAPEHIVVQGSVSVKSGKVRSHPRDGIRGLPTAGK